jgi:DNA-directed RNA polymerase specialized sigma24 family protein
MEAAPGQEPESSAEDDDGLEGGRATDALAALTPRQREAFALHKLANLPFAEVARRLKISKTSAFRSYREAHQQLLDALENP